MRDYDEITVFLGGWGPYQILAFFVLSVSVFPNGFGGLSIVFVGDIPKHRCFIPGNLNLSEAWMNRTIPLEQDKDKLQYSKCRRYRLDVIKNLSEIFPDPDSVNISEVGQEPCLDGWVYSKEQYISTIVSEWDLVCNNAWKMPFSMSVYFLGVLTGSFVSGILSDRFGRKAILFATMAVQTGFNVLQVFSSSWEIFCLVNFLIGIGQISNYVAAFVLGSELLGKSIRITFCTLGVGISYAFGYMFLPLVAYFIRSWRILLFALSLVGLIYIPLWWFIPESPRWLLSKGRVQEAEAIFHHIAKKNGTTLPEVLFSDLELEDIKDKNIKSFSITHLIKTHNIRSITIINLIVWFILAIGYYGLSLNTPNLHGDDYLNCFISGAIEIPANLAAWFFLQKFSRKLSLSGSLFFGGIVLFFVQLIPSSISILATMLVMIGKLANTCAFAIIYTYTAELYATVIRNTSVGVCLTASRLGSIISPYFFYLGAYYEFLPYILMGSLTIFSALLILLLPETINFPLPDTIDQMQRMKGFKNAWIHRYYLNTNETTTEVNCMAIKKEEL
ncbi:organic cation/carnitine transporter 2-like isoform X1 [Hemiscyllium ocellatum]|uniref:organic cation/carnitine transporter 2-like isoform X1 n=2 Tax=Hemiscyllium ocellatum TaxID=170820 RepID=UPI002966BE33|nr:organic cation/carnitine transporter 2-like isoform X1 [Hemiscyllium ocellatum]XP_060693283.1 organic cation/carnitine transporter 2-like isoform X1 [Hemiscyllium ocellatum]XP_060693284.1 organic cation/carnitine transporter 2-like isoform X1 [Hemiscyllium ocellatum]XP_060693285.1 organic cation/carnitine transporter 2-like isoform X1 [Hemiscyllium ocellatum]XP_060693286.1 organic cation/carnitine transporter 2-like isoform X1 [Hemiscyllium ocellatum]